MTLSVSVSVSVSVSLSLSLSLYIYIYISLCVTLPDHYILPLQTSVLLRSVSTNSRYQRCTTRTLNSGRGIGGTRSYLLQTVYFIWQQQQHA